jgi:hypothetical protein
MKRVVEYQEKKRPRDIGYFLKLSQGKLDKKPWGALKLGGGLSGKGTPDGNFEFAL